MAPNNGANPEIGSIEDREPPPPPTPPPAWGRGVPAEVRGDRMMADLRAACAFGPRPAASEAADAQRAWVASRWRAAGGLVRERPFPLLDPRDGSPRTGVNLIGSWLVDRPERVLIAAHGDTRPFPDREPDPEVARGAPFLGANDGASGVALLLEIARLLAHPPDRLRRGVDLVLFDAEEWVFPGEVGDYCLGSAAFARELERADAPLPVAAVVVDMIAKRRPAFEVETRAYLEAPELAAELWGLARTLGLNEFRPRVGPMIEDDHVPLLEAGIPAALVIDHRFPEWHTTRDQPSVCDPAGMVAAAKLITAWLR